MQTVTLPESTGRSVRTWPLIWALFLYASWYVLCAVVALWRAAYLRGGELYIPSQGDRYTDVIEIWPGALQPVGALLLLTAFVGHVFAAAMVLLAAFRLADPEVRASPATWIRLLIGTVLVVATLVLAFSSPGETVRNWIMD